MTGNLLKVEGLHAGVENKEILRGVDLNIGAGEVHVLMGPNGSGKSTLATTIMGDPKFEITSGKIYFEGEDITSLSTDKIAKKGLFYSFQNPIEVPGVTLRNFIRSTMEAVTGKRVTPFKLMKMLKEPMEVLGIDEAYLDRDLNVGFSGGEKKKAEILQLLMLEPKLAILDETDSGLDVDAVQVVSKGIREYRNKVNGAIIVITHNTKILSALEVDAAHVIVDGNIVDNGDASLVEKVNSQGFETYLNMEKGKDL